MKIEGYKHQSTGETFGLHILNYLDYYLSSNCCPVINVFFKKHLLLGLCLLKVKETVHPSAAVGEDDFEQKLVARSHPKLLFADRNDLCVSIKSFFVLKQVSSFLRCLVNAIFAGKLNRCFEELDASLMFSSAWQGSGELSFLGNCSIDFGFIGITCCKQAQKCTLQTFHLC